MKKSLLYLIPIHFTLTTLVVINNIRAQQFEWFSTSFPDSRFLNVIEKDGKYYGAVSNGASDEYDPNTIYQLTLYELEIDQSDSSGLVLNEITTIPYPENYATIEIGYIKETGLWIIVQSAVITENTQRYRAILCDDNFNIISEQSLDTIGYPISFHIDSYSGKTYILGSILGPPDELFFLQYSHLNPQFLPPFEVKQSEPRPMFAVTSMNIDERTGNMLVFYYGGIVELDSTLCQNRKFEYEQIMTGFYGSVLGTESNYFSHGLTFQDSGSWFKAPVLQKYDTLFNILDIDTLGIVGQDHYPFFTKSLDYKNNEFLVGGHLDGPFAHLDFEKRIKKYYLAKFDSEMNRIWYKEYGGDRAYGLIGLKLLNNGSSLAYGYVTDTLYGLWYAYIMHVDVNGEILTSQTFPTIQQTIQVINPGDETLQILNHDGLNTLVELYNIQGSFVLKAELNAGLTEVDTGKLPIGIYPYKLIRDEHVIGIGKWVKGE